MALYSCPECLASVAASARRCPQCGAYLWSQGRTMVAWIAVLFILVFIVGMLNMR